MVLNSPRSSLDHRLRQPLVGPIVWIVYFAIVYLVAEAACAERGIDFELLGLPGAAFVTVAATLVALSVTAFHLRTTWRRWHARPGVPHESEQSRMLGLLGLLLSAIFALAALAVGLPALLLTPC